MRTAQIPTSRSPKLERVVTLFFLVMYETRIVDRQHHSPSNSGIIAQLLAKGLIQRGRTPPVGRRISFVTLAPSGLDYLRQIGIPQLRRMFLAGGYPDLVKYLDIYGLTTYRFELGPLDEAEKTLYYLLQRAMFGFRTLRKTDAADKAFLDAYQQDRFDGLIALTPHPTQPLAFHASVTQAGLDRLNAAGGRKLRQVLEKSTDEGLLRYYLSKDLPEAPPTLGPWDH